MTDVVVKAAHFDLVVNDRYEAPRWVEDGMAVLAPCVVDGKPGGIRCKVLVAAGYHARVVNEKHGLDHWYAIEDLRIDLQRKSA